MKLFYTAEYSKKYYYHIFRSEHKRINMHLVRIKLSVKWIKIVQVTGEQVFQVVSSSSAHPRGSLGRSSFIFVCILWAEKSYFRHLSKSKKEERLKSE